MTPSAQALHAGGDQSQGQGIPPLRPGRTQPSARNVTLLPRHWAWLSAQPLGISATLRRLVEYASRDLDGKYQAGEARETCYFLMRDMAGDRPFFEEACRALFANNALLFEALVAHWPQEIGEKILAAAKPAWISNEHTWSARKP